MILWCILFDFSNFPETIDEILKTFWKLSSIVFKKNLELKLTDPFARRFLHCESLKVYFIVMLQYILLKTIPCIPETSTHRISWYVWTKNARREWLLIDNSSTSISWNQSIPCSFFLSFLFLPLDQTFLRNLRIRTAFQWHLSSFKAYSITLFFDERVSNSTLRRN